METVLLNEKHILLYLGNDDIKKNEEIDYLAQNFCGLSFCNLSDFTNHLAQNKIDDNVVLYLCGDIKKYSDSETFKKVRIITNLSSYNMDALPNIKYEFVTSGEVPINIHNVGVMFREFFFSKGNLNYFDMINQSHEFQSLRESNKETSAYRTGIYLTPIEKEGSDLKFRLLRCSTNLTGATDNFRDIDHVIVGKVNGMIGELFQDAHVLNHVLAQIYHNKIDKESLKESKERKARIKRHSDKTKDMPKNGLMAFCSFYQGYMNEEFDFPKSSLIKRSKQNTYDYCYKDKTTILTKLRFRLKDDVKDARLTRTFDVTLYPNSVFLMPLSMNRMYTHEIIPSTLPIDMIPTRMGYVIRCSNTEAIFKEDEDQTYLVGENNVLQKLEAPTQSEIDRLKEIYFRENTTSEMVFYKGFNFSLNEGDYTKPTFS